MAPVESLYTRTSYSQIPHRDKILTILRRAKIHTPVNEIRILKDGRFVMHADGFEGLLGIERKEVIRHIYAPREKGKITLFDLLVGIGFYPKEIKGWNNAYTRYSRTTGISEDAISIILFYFAYMVRVDGVSEKASILSRVIGEFGIRPLFESICMRASVRFFPGNNSPEPLDQYMLVFIALVNTLGMKVTVSKIIEYIKDFTGKDPSDSFCLADTSWEAVSGYKPLNTKLRTNDLWFDRDMRPYISLYGASVLTGFKRDKIERTLISIYGTGHGIGGVVNSLSKLYIPKEHVDKWIEVGVIPGDFLPDLARSFSIGDKGHIARGTKSLIDNYGTEGFLLSRSVIGVIGDKVIIPVPSKSKGEHYIQVYSIRSINTGSFTKPVSTRTLWMDENGKYRMSWRGIANLIGSSEATLKKLVGSSSKDDDPSIRQMLHDMGYNDSDITSMLMPRVGVPEDVIVLVVQCYCRMKKVNTVRALSLLVEIEENGIRDILGKAVAKIRSRDGDYIPVIKTKKKENKIAPLKYGDID